MKFCVKACVNVEDFVPEYWWKFINKNCSRWILDRSFRHHCPRQ